ncbi:photoactive yellow protein [Paracraurococcus ruber]|uniref:Photoactive yellow protein n=1 Tax=Paracraurococcus ruber TaxID=77675 RepID=A0ABS1D0L6_9PROT|nr:photoactive yellow protein [Paracraurococcus ruber]MBK1660063.1 photoactive yellow protein [Paracraurococcus ruber]TDG16698.1 photoactive yellow protein [Paracraurococcus ruber]
MEMIKFGTDHIDNLVAQDPSRLDRLPFGAILVDRNGRVLKYNAGEMAMSGRAAGDVVGKNFFNDVAPCTKGHVFQGRFQQGVAAGSLNMLFEYAFDYKMAPAKVRVHMKSTSVDDGIWIFIKRL